MEGLREQIARQRGGVTGHPSAISFTTILDGQDAKDLPCGCEEDPVVAKAQPEFAGVLALKRLHVAYSRDGVTIQAIEDAHGLNSVKSANIGARLSGPLDAKRHSL
jgi:hypothetical protein